MSRRTESREVANCRAKESYPSEAFARVVGQHALSRHDRWGETPDRLYPYCCPVCRAWHLTKRLPQPRAVPITAAKAFAFSEVSK